MMGCGTDYPERQMGMDSWGQRREPEVEKELRVLLAWLRVVLRV